MLLSADLYRKENAVEAYMNLVRGKGTMELPVGGVDHLNHISLADTSHRLEVGFDISLFPVLEQARATARARNHDD